ncbi:iron complex transport system permease protein [Nocardia amikacinitolerans]|uniref:FecCD family ABC transporter permease n=1 Tax=Nocardia amikacinitolerans TaxID=756689 RepID=UPI00083062EB|nr:iron ABC transporter permease [Nocardia amikacinitolerans]MCP2319179.1 iron complex transport system permease protein [Nocardia amikacinitolerans]
MVVETTTPVATSPIFRRRRVAVLIVVCAVALALFTILAIAFGEVRMSVPSALRAAFGVGDPGEVYVVQEFRAPRLVAGMIAGAGLAIAGAVLQRLFRNPLASPDVMGVTGGASLGAVLVLAAGAGQTLIPLGALGGGLFAAFLLGVLGWRSGLPVLRLVLVGLAVQAGLAAAVNLVVVRFPKELAGAAMQWTAGSLYGRTWPEVRGAAIACVLVLIALAVQHRTLAVLDLGDESAATLGVAVSAARLRLLLTTVALASLAAALAGPVSFVALAVPHLVRMLAGPPTAATLAATGLAGATLLVGCDLTAQHLLPIEGLPVGVVTATVGAPWLLILMLRDSGPAHRRNA